MILNLESLKTSQKNNRMFSLKHQDLFVKTSRGFKENIKLFSEMAEVLF